MGENLPARRSAIDHRIGDAVSGRLPGRVGNLLIGACRERGSDRKGSDKSKV